MALSRRPVPQSPFSLPATRRTFDSLPLGDTRIYVEAGQPIEDTAPSACTAAPDDLAYVLYTSGTTGKPDAATLPQVVKE